ncbi:MAG: MFS transporter [Elusimicrobiota bacterium]|nr:MFS transporter [Elusimicrobiota bacterium]
MRKKTIFSRDFVLVGTGQIISIFGNQMLRYALPLYLLNQTGSSALFGVVAACSFIPMLLLFPIGGIIADRFNKRNIMVILDFATAALIVMFCLLYGKIDIVPLMTVTMIILFGIQGAYQPAVKASVPVLVDEEYMMKANSVIDLIGSTASVAGPVLGGIAFSIFGLPPILYVSIVCFFVSAVMEIFIHMPHTKISAKGNILAVALGDIRESFRFIFKEKPAIWQMSCIVASVNLLLTTLILIGVPVIFTQRLDFETNTANRLYGYAQGVMGAGAVLGGVCAGALSNNLKLAASPFLLSGCALSILMGGVALHLFSSATAIYIVLAIGGGLLVALSTVFQIQMMTYFQHLTPENLIGKVISCVLCVCMCTNPIGQFVYGFVFEYIGRSAYVPFYAASLLMIAVSIFTRRIFQPDKRADS